MMKEAKLETVVNRRLAQLSGKGDKEAPVHFTVADLYCTQV